MEERERKLKNEGGGGVWNWDDGLEENGDREREGRSWVERESEKWCGQTDRELLVCRIGGGGRVYQ